MEKINLDHKDVEAIADNRKFDIPPWPKWKKIISWTLLGICLIFCIIFLWDLCINRKATPAKDAYFLMTIYLSGVGLYLLTSLFNKPARRARRSFIEHWENTGEIPPRWIKNGKEKSGQNTAEAK